MSVVIRLMRAGAKKRPFYRLVAADSRRQRDGRFLEILGHYNPLTTPLELVVRKERVEEWLGHGAQPSTQVASLLKRAGMSWHRPSKPKKVAAVAAAAVAAAPKAAKAKRKAPRKTTARRVARKAARKTATPKPKAKSKKSK
jgi:small subunit ribosomal protein S16